MNLNLANNTFSNSGTPYTIVSATAFSTSSSAQSMFIVRTRNGNLLTGWKDTNIAAMDTLKSTDTGATWSSIDEVWDGTTSHDLVIGVPCNTGDSADGAVLYWDRSADEITIKVYDDSVDNWVESTVSTGMVEPGPEIWNWSVATFRSNGKVFLAAFDDVDGTAPDLKTWLLDINSVSSPSVTAKGSVLTATNEAVCPAVFIDPRTDDIYVCYLTGTAYQATLNPFYKKSSDTGGNWGSAVALSDAAEDDYRALSVGSTCFTNGGKMMPVWMDDDDADLLTSLFADVVLTSDVLVETNSTTQGNWSTSGLQGPYWITDQVGAIIFIDSNQDMAARKTTDGGQTWAAAVTAEAGQAIGVSSWFDQQTVGDTGTKVHCCWTEVANTDFTYANYDISSNAWSTPVDITGTATVGGQEHSGIVKARNGNLVAVKSGGTVGNGTWKSTDAGASWSSINACEEGTAPDHLFGACVDTGDTADVAMIFWDVSADQISVKMYDDSGNTWTETNIASSQVDDLNNSIQFCASTRLSDGHMLLVAWNAVDSATADLTFWELTLNSIASPTIGSPVTVVSNSSESGACSIFIDQTNDDMYVSYLRGTTWTDLTKAYYVKSTDGGASWGSEQTYQQQIEDDFRGVGRTAMGAASGGGRFMPAFVDDDDDDIFVNYNNSVSIAAVSSSLPDGKAVFSTVPRPKRALVVDELISPLTLGIPNEVEALPTGRAILDFIPRGKRGRGDQVDQPPLVMGIFQTPPEGKVYYDTTYRGKRGRTDQVDQPPAALGVFHTPPDGRTWLQRNPLPKRGAWVDELRPPSTLGIPDETAPLPEGDQYTATVLPPKRGRTDQVTQPPLVMGVFHTPPEGRVQYSETTRRGKRGRADFVLPPPLTLGVPDEPPTIPPGLRYYETTRRGKRGRPDLQWSTPRALEAESRVQPPFKPDVQLTRRKPRKIFESLARWFFLEESATPAATRPKLGLGRGTGRAARRGRGSASGDNLPRGRATGRH